MKLFSETCHDPGNSRGNSSAEEFKGVLRDLIRSSLVFALCTRSHHAWFEEDSFKHDIVLGKVEEDLSPHFLRNFEGPVNAMVSGFRWTVRNASFTARPKLLPSLQVQMDR